MLRFVCTLQVTRRQVSTINKDLRLYTAQSDAHIDLHKQHNIFHRSTAFLVVFFLKKTYLLSYPMSVRPSVCTCVEIFFRGISISNKVGPIVREGVSMSERRDFSKFYLQIAN